jgi:hypothetical protein
MSKSPGLALLALLSTMFGQILHAAPPAAPGAFQQSMASQMVHMQSTIGVREQALFSNAPIVGLPLVVVGLNADYGSAKINWDNEFNSMLALSCNASPNLLLCMEAR